MVNGSEIGVRLVIDGRLFGAVLFGLFMFGLAYNALVETLGARKDGYTAFMVVGGVLVTMLGVALISWEIALLVTLAFVASGTPMVLGDMWRTIRKREEALRAQRDEVEQAVREAFEDDEA